MIEITPLIITFNEQDNIGRTLAKLTWARRVVVVDSGSNDKTLEILSSFPMVEVFHRPFDDFASQCNFGLKQIGGGWVLSLDADYELSDAVVEELRELSPVETTCGYSAHFVYRVWGIPLRGGIYPPRTVLYRRETASYVNVGHTQRVMVSGETEWLRGRIYHDDRKSLERWFASQQRYAAREADYLLAMQGRGYPISARIRRLAWPAPILVFFYTLFCKGCVLDGWPGWFYCLQRTLAEIMMALQIIDRRLRQKNHPAGKR